MLSHPLTDRIQNEDIIIVYDTVLTWNFVVWNELSINFHNNYICTRAVFFTDVKIGILIIYYRLYYNAMLCIYSYIVLLCLLPYALLWHIVYISQYIDQDQMNCAWLN